MQFLHWYRFYPSIWAVKFLCTECETHRFGSSIHSPPQIGVCLTDFPSTVPESVSCCMTWSASCRWLAAPLIPCLPECCSAQWDSLLGYTSTSSCPGVRLQGTCCQVCFLAAAQELWHLPYHEPQHADMSSAQGQSTVLSYSLEKKKHERMEPFLNEVMQSYSQVFLPELDDLKNLFAYFFQPVSNILESHLLLQISFWSSVISG